MNTALIVKGSLLDVSQGGDPTQALMEAKLILVCDRSGSMVESDADSKPRYAVEDEVVKDLQGKYAGQIAVVTFSDSAYMCLDGILPYPEGGTNMSGALRFVQPVVEAGIHAALISDGLPDDKEPVLYLAKQMKGFLDVVFIGKKGSEGDKFMKEVAKAAGGSHETNEATKMLSKTLTHLLLKAGGG